MMLMIYFELRLLVFQRDPMIRNLDKLFATFSVETFPKNIEAFNAKITPKTHIKTFLVYKVTLLQRQAYQTARGSPRSRLNLPDALLSLGFALLYFRHSYNMSSSLKSTVYYSFHNIRLLNTWYNS